LGGRTFLERAIDLGRALCGEVIIVGRPDSSCPGIAALPDEEPGLGPLGGLATGLGRVKGSRALCLVVDQPLLTPGLLRRLLAVPDDYDAAAFRLGGSIEPFPCVYSTRVQSAAQRCVRKGSLSASAFLQSIRTAYIAVGPTRRVREAFLNVNTPQALQRAEEIAAGRP